MNSGRIIPEFFAKTLCSVVKTESLKSSDLFWEKLFLRKTFIKRLFRINGGGVKIRQVCQNYFLRPQNNIFANSCFFPTPGGNRDLTLTLVVYWNYFRQKFPGKFRFSLPVCKKIVENFCRGNQKNNWHISASLLWLIKTKVIWLPGSPNETIESHRNLWHGKIQLVFRYFVRSSWE